MLFDFSVSFLFCLAILYFYKNSKEYYKTKIELIKPFFAFFHNSQEYITSIYQKIYCFPENQLFDYLTVILNLKKKYDPFSYLFPENETIIITGKLKKKMNTFIYKRGTALKHVGMKYVTKQKEKGKYKVLGNKHFVSFVEKYEINKFYVSYFPKTLVRDCSYKCILYLEMNLSKLNDTNTKFYEDFCETIQTMPDCTDKVFEENKLRYEKDVGIELMKLNIKQREAEIVENRQKNGEDVVKRKKNKGKVVYSNKRK
ncbi:hypothetical protein BDAP_000220 [Binucleata daphniae]